MDEETTRQVETAGAEDATRGAEREAAAALERAVGRYRELLVRANPDAVPELIAGGSVEELDGSLETAKAAYARARDAARRELAASGPLPSSPPRRDAPPAGLEAAGPLAKIAWGLREG